MALRNAVKCETIENSFLGGTAIRSGAQVLLPPKISLRTIWFLKCVNVNRVILESIKILKQKKF